DGVPDANHTANQAAIKTNSNALQIGRSLYTSPSAQFDGKIDDVHIYDRALNAGEIWQLYQDGLP
ncbi:MAG: LamG-like jellyroll fold domain-containing protein, partial [Planctomycetota bacterium]